MTKFAPHKTLKLSAYDRLTFVERVVLHRVVCRFFNKFHQSSWIIYSSIPEVNVKDHLTQPIRVAGKWLSGCVEGAADLSTAPGSGSCSGSSGYVRGANLPRAFRVQGSGFRVQGSGFRVQGLGSRV